MEFSHIPVLCKEVLEALQIRPDGVYVDGTVGGAGHALEIARRLAGNGFLLGLDRDPDAVAVARERLRGYPARVFEATFDQMARILPQTGFEHADGVLLDLGVSSHQLDDPARGFSYRSDAPLDMRMSRKGPTAADFVNNASQEELERVLITFGEERHARPIAAKIIKRRAKKPILTTTQLADIVISAYPPKERRAKNPARKSFQALRIAVNGELEQLANGLKASFSVLKPGGRLAVLTFHSLEDRLVKEQYAAWCQGCTCPPDFPVCVCGKKPRGRLLTRKPIVASKEELEQNRRARSAKLRVLEKI